MTTITPTLPPESLLVSIVFCLLILWCVWRIWDSLHEVVENHEDPHWEVFRVLENGELIGYKVRWNTPDEEGRYLWVGHYYACENGGPSINWCLMAATRHCERYNDEKRMPCEFERNGLKI